MLLKRCSISVCDIKSKSFGESSPLSASRPLKPVTNTENATIPLDDLCCVSKRNRTDLNPEEMSGEQKRKCIRVDSESEVNQSKESESSKEEEDESHDDPDYEVNRNKESEGSESSEEVNQNKENDGSESSEEEDDESDDDYEKTKMSAFEKMVQQKRLERLKILEDLKIKEIKSEFADAVMRTKKRKSTPRIVQKKEISNDPPRRSRRLAHKSINFEEGILFDNAQYVEKPKLEKHIPSKLTFAKALNSEELYNNYMKDINIQNSRSLLKSKDFFYDRSVLNKLKLEDSHIIKIVPERVCSLAWYPSARNLILAAGSKMGNIGIWNIDSESSHLFEIHNEGCTHIQFNPFDPVKLFSSSYEGILRCGDMVKHVFDEVYNVADESCCTYFDFVSSTTYVVALKNGQVALVDRRNAEKPCVKKHDCHETSIKTVNLHPVNKNYFLTASNRGPVRLWDLRKLQTDPVVHIDHHKRCVNSAFFSSVTGNSILTTSFDDSVCIFDSQNLTQDIKVISQMRHNNNTGRWLTIFRATWLPNSDEYFVLGSMQDYPRRIEVFDKDLNISHLLRHENLTTITSVNMFHPYRYALAGSNSSGKVFVFT